MRAPTISPPPSKRRRRLSKSQALPVASVDDHITLYSYNVNGIQPFLQRSITSFFERAGSQEDTPRASLRDFLRRHDWPAMLFLQEVKVSSSDDATKRLIEQAVSAGSSNIGEPSYVAHLCLPSDKFNARVFGGKLYGVCSIIRKDVYDGSVVKVRPVGWDSEGRFLVTEMKPNDYRPKLAIINAYMVRKYL